jgi:hypothetical protein
MSKVGILTSYKSKYILYFEVPCHLLPTSDTASVGGLDICKPLPLLAVENAFKR